MATRFNPTGPKLGIKGPVKYGRPKPLRFNPQGSRMTLTGPVRLNPNPTVQRGPLGLLAPKPPMAAPPRPATPPRPAPDPVLQQRQVSLNTAYQDALGRINYDEGRIKQEYGFDDLSNPFSRARLLQRSYQERQAGTKNSMAARGMLYSGARLNQERLDTRAYDQAYDGLRRNYDDQLQSILDRRLSARRARDDGNIDALGESRDRQLEQRPDPTTLPPETAPAPPRPAPAAAPPNAPAEPNDKLSAAARRRRTRRQRAGVTDVRNTSAAQRKRLRKRGLL